MCPFPNIVWLDKYKVSNCWGMKKKGTAVDEITRTKIYREKVLLSIKRMLVPI